MIPEFAGNRNFKTTDATISAKCPSNIALIKYWGKYSGQIPANPSISYTLNNCRTETSVVFKNGEPFSITTSLSGKNELKFAKKIEQYFESIQEYLPWILSGSYQIFTENTFPHSSGIASSASGFGAIALCLMKLDEKFSGKLTEPERLRKASFLARLGSGSACRSIYNGMIVWGETVVVPGSSDLYAVPFPLSDIHPTFRNFHDWVLLIHEGEKSVSSTVGHGLMNSNPYAGTRFAEAAKNFHTLQKILKTGDMEAFIELVEHEALTLHAMMMLGKPPFILMKEGTLKAIQKIWNFRRITSLPLFFTLDAGANVHLLFPEDTGVREIRNFIQQELVPFTQNGTVIKDVIKF